MHTHADEAERDRLDAKILLGHQKLEAETELMKGYEKVSRAMVTSPEILSHGNLSVFTIGEMIGMTSSETDTEVIANLAVAVATDVNGEVPQPDCDLRNQLFAVTDVVRHSFFY